MRPSLMAILVYPRYELRNSTSTN